MNNAFLTIIMISGLNLIWAQSSLYMTKHNLSVTGAGEIKEASETEICSFCHAGHKKDAPGATRNSAANPRIYSLYGSPSMEARSRQPGSSSRLCLSCHDGTIALGLSSGRGKLRVGQGIKIPAMYRSNLSVNLANDHPMNIDSHPSGYNCSGCHSDVKESPSSIECTTCHDPHSDNYGKFLVSSSRNSDLCINCHEHPNWHISIHNNSSAVWNGNLPDPWPLADWNTVQENGCSNCHVAHNSPSEYWLLQSAAEEENCLSCHNGNVASKDLQSVFQKYSSHRVSGYYNLHQPDELSMQMPDHVECTDCHNPHESVNNEAVAPYVPGSMLGVAGVNKDGVDINTAQFEYEVCLKCHQNMLGTIPVYVPRQTSQGSIRLEFSETNPSFHPVFAQGKNRDVPSLISPSTSNTLIYCTDCHNNDDASYSGNPNGPHGSNYIPLLRDRQLFSDYNPESSSIYALCYRCHDRHSILNDENGFPHSKHIRDEKTACTTCHDPHGSYNNTHLINFNSNYVQPNKNGQLDWIDLGTYSGQCYLKCHNVNHNPKIY